MLELPAEVESASVPAPVRLRFPEVAVDIVKPPEVFVQAEVPLEANVSVEPFLPMLTEVALPVPKLTVDVPPAESKVRLVPDAELIDRAPAPKIPVSQPEPILIAVSVPVEVVMFPMFIPLVVPAPVVPGGVIFSPV